MRGLALAALLGAAAASPGAQEYSLKADIQAASVLDWTGEGEGFFGDGNGRATDRLNLYLMHSLTLQSGSFSAAQDLTLQGNEVTQKLWTAYMRWDPADNLSFFAGKRRLDWGNGIFFHPVDSLQTWRFGERRLEGMNGLGLEWTPDWRVSLALTAILDRVYESWSSEEGMNPSKAWRDMEGAFKGTVVTGPLETSLSLALSRGQTVRPGISASLDAAGFILSGEGAWEFAERAEGEGSGTGNAPLWKLALHRNLSVDKLPGSPMVTLGAEWLDDGTAASDYRYRGAFLASLALGTAFTLEASSTVNPGTADLELSAEARYALEGGPDFGISAAGTSAAGKPREVTADVTLHY